MEVRIPSVAPVAFLVGCGVAAAGFLLVPSDIGPEVLHASVGFAAVGAIVVGVVHHQPVHRLAWVLQAVGLTSILVAQLVGWWDAEAGTERFPAPADALILLGLAALVASMAVRVREALVARDPFGSIDTAIMGVAVALLALVFLVEPIVATEGASAVEQVWAVAPILLAVILLAGVARLVLGTASRTASLLLTVTGIVTLVGGEVALRLLDGSPLAGGSGSALASGSGPVHLGFLVAWALMGASAVDPSMADRLAPPAGGAHIQPGRIATVLTFVLLAPTVLVVHVVVADQPRPMFLVASAVATMAGLVLALARMAFVVGSVETRTVQAGEDRFEALVEHSTDVIGVVDREGMVIYVSPAFRTALGRDPDGFVGSALRRIAHPDDVATLTTHLFQASTRPRHATSRFETRLLATDGTVREFEVVAANLVGDGVVDGLALTMRDITDRKALAAELSHQAFHDSLTGLANRPLFADRVDHALHRRRRDPDCAIAVLFVDLDDFKAVNDGLGHGAGDTLLRAVGQRIVRCLRAGDTAARLGGDEFAVLLEDDRAPSEAATIAARILDALRVPVSIGDMELGVVASIGLTVADAASTTVGLLRDADIAMYEAKRGGKGRVCMFDPAMRESASDRLALQTDLSVALEHGELRVVYQPIVSLDTGLVGGAEALVRWTHPDRGEVMPDSFIPVAEQTGLVVPIGAWVLARACEQAARTGSTIGVNVSGVQFSAPDFLDTVAHALEDSGLPPSRLTVEITETALMADTNATAQLLDRLRAVGVRIAIDDFGTGYCSLAYLQRFAVDIVKIDKAFVAELNEQSKGSRLAQTILQMADSLDVTTVVAEGIETEQQLDALRALGCHYGQGFLLSRPLEQDAYHALLAEDQPDLAVSVPRQPRPRGWVTGVSGGRVCSTERENATRRPVPMTATDTTTNDGTTNDPGPIGERDRFDSLDPASGAVVGTHPVHSAADVAAAVARARMAATSWAALDFDGRAPLLRAWKALMTRRADELADLVHAETGKPHGDAMLEIVLAVDHLAWAGGHAEKVLRRRRVSPGLLMANHAATLEYLPLGVIGVIGPWNYPVFTPMGSIAYALAAGNAVVFKPSEHTPGVGEWLAEAAAEAIGIPGLFEVVTGFGATGGALVTAGVDKIAFTGSTATAKKIMAAAADTLTPVLIECGGKDAMVVDADADVAAAADAATWGALSNAGQTCVGVERAYVHTDVYDAFVEKVVAQASEVDAGSGPDADIGPITMPGQLEVIRSHIADALARGGRALVGGVDAVDDRYARPTVLVDVPEDALANTDETFGPTLTIARVRDIDEAVTKANASRYGLGATVFSQARGPELARRLRSGMTAVNSVISFAGIPSLPFGGVGDSGFGRIHGADGLREFTRAKAVARQRMPAPLSLTTFSRGARTDRAVKALIGILHGRGPKRT